MKKKYVTLSFKKMGYNDFLDKVREIQTFLSAPMFSTIQPTPAEVIPLLDQLQLVWTQTKAGNRLLIGERDELRLLITNLLERQALAVNYLADGNMNILLNCGFDLDKTPEQAPEPAQGTVLSAISLPGGATIVDTQRIDGADWYQLKITGPNNFVKWQTGKYAKFKIADLPKGVTLQVVVRAVNYRGEGAWSNPLGFVAQINPDINSNLNDNVDGE